MPCKMVLQIQSAAYRNCTYLAMLPQHALQLLDRPAAVVGGRHCRTRGVRPCDVARRVSACCSCSMVHGHPQQSECDWTPESGVVKDNADCKFNSCCGRAASQHGQQLPTLCTPCDETPVLAAGAAAPLAVAASVLVCAVADVAAGAALGAAAAAPAAGSAAGVAAGLGLSAPSASESANMSSPSLSANMSFSAASTAGLLANMLAALAKSACTSVTAGDQCAMQPARWVHHTVLNEIPVAAIPKSRSRGWVCSLRDTLITVQMGLCASTVSAAASRMTEACW